MSLVLLAAATAAADVSAADPPAGQRHALSVREAHRCWPRRHFKPLGAADRARVDEALESQAAPYNASSPTAWALRKFERFYVQERNGRIHIYAEPPRIYAHPEDAEPDGCPSLFGRDVADDQAFWRATYDPRTGTFLELDLANINAHL